MKEKYLKGSDIKAIRYSYETGEFIRIKNDPGAYTIQIAEDLEDFLNQDADIKNIDVFVPVDKDTLFNIMEEEIQNVSKKHLDKSEARLLISGIISRYSKLMDMII